MAINLNNILIKELSKLLHAYAHEAIDQDKVLKYGDSRVIELDEEYARKVIKMMEDYENKIPGSPFYE